MAFNDSPIANNFGRGSPRNNWLVVQLRHLWKRQEIVRAPLWRSGAWRHATRQIETIDVLISAAVGLAYRSYPYVVVDEVMAGSQSFPVHFL